MWRGTQAAAGFAKYRLFVRKEELEQLKTYYVLQLVRGYTSLSAAGCRADVVCGDLTSLGSG